MGSHDSLLRRLQDASDRLRAERAERARTTADQSILLEDASSRHRGVLLAVLANPHIADEIFDAIDADDVAVQRAMAKHPQCSPAALERLALSMSPEVRDLAARHDRITPVGRAWALEAHEPEVGEATGSQVTAALLDPKASAARAYLELVEDAPNSAWEWRREAIVAQHHRAPTDLLMRVLDKVACSLQATRPIVEPRLVLHQRDPGATAVETLTSIAVGIARHPSTTTPMLRTLATINEADVLAALAKNPKTAKPDLKHLVAVEDSGLRMAVAAHPSRRIRDFEAALYALDDEGITRTLAGNHFVRESLLERILNDSPPVAVLQALAGNPELQGKHLMRLAGHEDERIAAAVAGNPSTDITHLAASAQRPSALIHLALATNPEATPQILEQLYENRLAEGVAQAVLGHPNVPPTLLSFAYQMEDALYGMASNPRLPEHLQVQLARSLDSMTLLQLALNANTTAAALEIVQSTLDSHRIDFDNAPPGREDPVFPAFERQALHAIAAHANCPPPVLDLLSAHRDLHIALTARISLRINT